MTAKDKDDQDLKAYLEGKDRVSSEYQLGATEQPPEHIDAAILAASRRSAAARPKPLSAYRSWHVPLSIAAVVVLSVLLVFNIPNETDRALFEPARQVVPETPADQFDFAGDRREIVLEESQAVMQGEVQDAPASVPAPPMEMKAMPSVSPGLSDFAGGNGATQDQDANAPVETLGGAFNERDDTARQVQDVPASLPATTVLRSEEAASSSAEPESRFRAVAEADEAAGAELDLLQSNTVIQCTTPRPEFCAEIYQPVCAIRDTGIRCVTTPCDSTEQVDYANACSACSDPEVLGYVDGRCE
jgi:hypothetical protein